MSAPGAVKLFGNIFAVAGRGRYNAGYFARPSHERASRGPVYAGCWTM